MEDNKLFVFEKKEVLLIFLFIILIAVISFTLGVRTGKQLSLKNDQYTNEDVARIDLKSDREENIEKVISDKESNSFEDSMNEPSKDEIMEDRLKAEMEKLAKEDVKVEQAPVQQMDDNPAVVKKNDKSIDDGTNELAGKYTIQLFSNQSREVAQDFADGFISKGYDMIINEVILESGKWYRVSIGVFENVNAAKDYLEKQKSLFQNKKYIITQF